MQKISGRLIFKSTVRTGTNEFGAWSIVNFVLRKTFQKKKYDMLFTAKGKWSKFINEVPYKERVTVHYYIKSTEYKPQKWATDLVAFEIEKYVPKNMVIVRYEGEIVNKSDIEFIPDLQLDFNKKNDKKGGSDVPNN